jgi:cell division control protein 45
MYLEVDQWYNGYEQILFDARPDADNTRGHRSVLLLCNADVDAMASARILTYLLRSDAVQYQLMPCTSYSDLKETLRDMKDNFDSDDICAVVLLNFGASRNLTELYAVDDAMGEPLLPETVKIYVMDCRRPVHLANIYEDETIVVFLNESKEHIAEFPSDGDDLSGNEEESDSSDSEDEDSDEEEEEESNSDGEKEESDDEDEHQASFDDVEGSAPKKKQERVDDDYDGEDESEDDDRQEEQDVKDDRQEEAAKQPSSKRQKTYNDSDGSNDETRKGDETAESDAPASQGDGDAQDNIPEHTPMSQRRLHKDRTQRLIRYYDQGSYFAAPVSYIAYHISEQLRHREEADLLWLACVGVTDAYLHARVDKSGFGEIGHALRSSCLKMFPDSRVDRAMNSFNAEHLDGRDPNNLNYHQNLTKIKFSDNGRILAENDYRFFLMRHSSLLDSMLYSEYVYSKLQMNTKKGQQRFMEMLAKMGLPLDECRQPYRFMKTSLLSRLKTEFENYADVSCVFGDRSKFYFVGNHSLKSYFFVVSPLLAIIPGVQLGSERLDFHEFQSRDRILIAVVRQ